MQVPGIYEAEETGGFSLTGFRPQTGRTVRVLRRKSFKSYQFEVSRVSEVKEIWFLCGCYFAGSTGLRGTRVTLSGFAALGHLVFLRAEGVVVPEAEPHQHP